MTLSYICESGGWGPGLLFLFDEHLLIYFVLKLYHSGLLLFLPTSQIPNPSCWIRRLGFMTFLPDVKELLQWAGVAQCCERSPSTNATRVRIPEMTPYVVWACCWSSSLLRGCFAGFSDFPTYSKTNTLNSNSILRRPRLVSLVGMLEVW